VELSAEETGSLIHQFQDRVIGGHLTADKSLIRDHSHMHGLAKDGYTSPPWARREGVDLDHCEDKGGY
jgi:hypothetical protein